MQFKYFLRLKLIGFYMESIGMETLEIFRPECGTEGGECNFPEDIEFFPVFRSIRLLQTSSEAIIFGTTLVFIFNLILAHLPTLC